MRGHIWQTIMVDPSVKYEVSVGSCDVESTSLYDEQIKIDIIRTHPTDTWFDCHRPTLCRLLNSFALRNVGFGYSQGLNYLIFVLWKVFYNDDPITAERYTLSSLQYLVGKLMTVYPLSRSDSQAMVQMQTICTMVRLRCSTKYPKLQDKLFSRTYEPMLVSLVTRVVPTMFSNIFDVDQCMLLWDELLIHDRLLEALVTCVSNVVSHNHNAIANLPLYNCMTVVQTSMKIMCHTIVTDLKRR